MIDPHTTMIGILCGCVLIALGLVPGLFQTLTDGLLEGARNFKDQLSYHRSLSPPRRTEYPKLQRPVWLAGLGAALIVLSVAAYLP